MSGVDCVCVCVCVCVRCVYILAMSEVDCVCVCCVWPWLGCAADCRGVRSLNVLVNYCKGKEPKRLADRYSYNLRLICLIM
jgi:hypothetical protein